MPMPATIGGTFLLAGALAGCTRPSEDRAADELLIGHAELTDSSVRVEGGLAAIREFSDYRLELWSSSPVLSIELDVDASAAGDWTLTIRNSLPDAVLTVAGTPYPRAPDQHPTVARVVVPLAAGTHRLSLAPPDAELREPFRVAAMADIQAAMPDVDDVFRRINAEPGVRFVVGMGDISERAEIEEYDLFDRQLIELEVPFYTTLGNHDLWAHHSRFHSRYGRGSFSFQFKGVTFSFADSGNADIDPLVETWLDEWLAAARNDTHIFLTHFPPIDPVGARYGGFRSADDGRRLLSRLAGGNVDLTLYGHIHSYVGFDNAGIPAHISGGGGAEPMRWDGIDRHFLVVDANADGVVDVTVRRVD